MPDSYIAPEVNAEGIPIGSPDIPTTEPSALDALEDAFRDRLGIPASPPATPADGEGESSVPSPTGDSPPSDDVLTPSAPSDTITPEAPPASVPPTPVPGDPSTPAPPEPGVTPPPADLDTIDANAAFEEMFGFRPSREQVTSLLTVWNDLANMDPQRAEYAEYILKGGDLSVFQQQAPAPQPAPAPTPTVDEWGDPVAPPTVSPMVQAEIDALKAQVAQQNQITETLQQQQQRAWQEQMVADQRAGATEWAQNAPIAMTAEHLAVLEAKVAQANIFPTAFQRSGNARQAIKDSLDYIVRTDPVEAQRLIDAQVAQKMAERDAEDQRLRAAGSLTAGGGAPPIAPGPVKVGKMSRAELESAIAADVRTNLFGDGSGS